MLPSWLALSPGVSQLHFLLLIRLRDEFLPSAPSSIMVSWYIIEEGHGDCARVFGGVS